ncbi:MmyB family transcriptional regulator [Streptomyces sp. 900105755]
MAVPSRSTTCCHRPGSTADSRLSCSPPDLKPSVAPPPPSRTDRTVARLPAAETSVPRWSLAEHPPARPARQCLHDPTGRGFFSHWEEAANTTVIVPRTEAGRAPHDTEPTGLIGELVPAVRSPASPGPDTTSASTTPAAQPSPPPPRRRHPHPHTRTAYSAVPALPAATLSDSSSPGPPPNTPAPSAAPTTPAGKTAEGIRAHGWAPCLSSQTTTSTGPDRSGALLWTASRSAAVLRRGAVAYEGVMEVPRVPLHKQGSIHE